VDGQSLRPNSVQEIGITDHEADTITRVRVRLFLCANPDREFYAYWCEFVTPQALWGTNHPKNRLPYPISSSRGDCPEVYPSNEE